MKEIKVLRPINQQNMLCEIYGSRVNDLRIIKNNNGINIKRQSGELGIVKSSEILDLAYLLIESYYSIYQGVQDVVVIINTETNPL